MSSPIRRCIHCAAVYYDFIVEPSHKEGCPLSFDYEPPSYGNCEVCKIELDDCNWAFWEKNRKLCRDCVEEVVTED